MKRFVFIIVLCALACLPGPLSAGDMVISFTGDIMMHNAIKRCAAAHDEKDPNGASKNNAGFDLMFESIAPRLHRADIIVGNLEFPIAGTFMSREIVFNCRPEVLQALKKAGFTMLNLANNHILDQGVDGAKETLERVLQSGLDAIGAAGDRESAGVIKKSGNLRVAFLACTGIINYPISSSMKGLHINWFYNEDEMTKQIRRMKELADYVILSVHTGVEYMVTPRPEDAALMKKYCDAGADCIIGHHPHMLQPAEKYTAADGRECQIFYSLGNFISSYSIDAKKSIKGPFITSDESVIVTMRLKKSIVTKKVSVSFSLLPILTVKSYNKDKTVTEIRTVAVTDHIKQMKNSAAVSDKGPLPGDEITIAREKQSRIRSIINENRRADTISFDD